MPEIRKVAVIGAGPLGRRLAWTVARAGYSVVLEDVMPANLRHAQELAAATGEGSTVTYATSVEDAVREADLAFDCVPDELESKLEIFCLMDRMAPPRTILLTPTTAQSITDLASCTYRAELCAALTLKNIFLGDVEIPQELELVFTQQTNAATRTELRRFLTSLGRTVREREDRSLRR
jgi:3-hydroxybutyryl-CoA dehydrogenase